MVIPVHLYKILKICYRSLADFLIFPILQRPILIKRRAEPLTSPINRLKSHYTRLSTVTVFDTHLSQGPQTGFVDTGAVVSTFTVTGMPWRSS